MDYLMNSLNAAHPGTLHFAVAVISSKLMVFKADRT